MTSKRIGALAVAALVATAAPAAAQTMDHGGHGMYVLPGPTTTTDAQRAYAERLLAASLMNGPRWATRRLARADGYRPLGSKPDAAKHVFHYNSAARLRDGHRLDPRRPESLVFENLGGGRFALVGLMFRVPAGGPIPHPAGALMPWHVHYHCVMPGDPGATSRRGPCDAGMVMRTGPTAMAHVWFVDDLTHSFDIGHPPLDLLRPATVR